MRASMSLPGSLAARRACSSSADLLPGAWTISVSSSSLSAGAVAGASPASEPPPPSPPPPPHAAASASAASETISGIKRRIRAIWTSPSSPALAADRRPGRLSASTAGRAATDGDSSSGPRYGQTGWHPMDASIDCLPGACVRPRARGLAPGTLRDPVPLVLVPRPEGLDERLGLVHGGDPLLGPARVVPERLGEGVEPPLGSPVRRLSRPVPRHRGRGPAAVPFECAASTVPTI